MSSKEADRDDRERTELLGLRKYSPQEATNRPVSPLFASVDEHHEFLRSTLANPDRFWRTLGDTIQWRERPSSVGGPGRWFPGGSLNLTEVCLAPTDDAPLQGPVLCRIGPSAGKTSCLSRAELIARVDAVESRVAEFGLTPGDRILLALPGREMMLVAILACLRRGLTCVPQSPRYPAERLARRYQATGCKAEILAPDVPSSGRECDDARRLVLGLGWEKGEGAGLEPVAVDPMHPAFVLASSTGELFTLPTAGFLVHAINSYRYLLDGQGQGDLLWLMTPPHHASLLSATIASLAHGGQVGVLPDEATASTDALLSSFSVLQPRVLIANVKYIMRAARSAIKNGLRPRGRGPELLIIEGEMLEPRIYRALRDDIFDGKTHVVQVLSRPESGGFVAGPYPPITLVRPASVALPAPGLDITIVNGRNEELPPYHGGLLALRRPVPGLALELQNLEPPLPLEVKAKYDERGHLWTIGEVRVGRIQKRPVALRELESALASLKGVENVVVIRTKDDAGEERTRAFVKPESGQTVDINGLREIVASQFSADAMPDSFQIVRQLPYSRSGKLLRSVLKRIVSGEPLDPGHVSSVTDPAIVEELQRSMER